MRSFLRSIDRTYTVPLSASPVDRNTRVKHAPSAPLKRALGVVSNEKSKEIECPWTARLAATADAAGEVHVLRKMRFQGAGACTVPWRDLNGLYNPHGHSRPVACDCRYRTKCAEYKPVLHACCRPIVRVHAARRCTKDRQRCISSYLWIC